jgi:hypothetical protein
MAHVSDLISTDIEQYLKAHERKGLLRFITCGSVDDGKSTLIGRLLFESKMLFEDQLAAIEADSKSSRNATCSTLLPVEASTWWFRTLLMCPLTSGRACNARFATSNPLAHFSPAPTASTAIAGSSGTPPACSGRGAG